MKSKFQVQQVNLNDLLMKGMLDKFLLKLVNLWRGVGEMDEPKWQKKNKIILTCFTLIECIVHV
jgi:hypothetical protein